MKMNIIKTVLFLFISLILIFNRAANADKEDKSGDVADEEEIKMQDSVNTSVEIGPPDSHEAMNNRDSNTGGAAEAAAKINVREKRSYQFLMGLVNNNSRYEQLRKDDARLNSEQITSEASELLLELMVRIAAHPQQWSEVHKLLRKIDTDLMTSKKILTEMQNSVDVDQNQSVDDGDDEKQIEVKKDKVHQHQGTLTKIQLHKQQPQLAPMAMTTTSSATTEQSTISTTENKMVIILDGKSNTRNNGKKENLTVQATKENAWPEFKDVSSSSSSSGLVFPSAYKELTHEQQTKTVYPWQQQQQQQQAQQRPPNKNSYQRNLGFSYHRVTGKPTLHHRPNPELNQRTHNAYIAVSVIAPKEHYDPKDKLLENELRQLKPWSHNQNLKNMAALRSNWIIQHVNDNSNNAEQKEKTA